MSIYKLYTDKNEIFKSTILIEGGNKNNSKVRLVLKNDVGADIVYNGTISSDGICEIKINDVKRYFKEQDTGDMILEVIVDDTLIEAWESKFLVDKKIKVEVKVNDQSNIIKEDTSNKVLNNSPISIKVQVNEQLDPDNKIINTIKVLSNKMKIKLINENKTDILKLINDYKKIKNVTFDTKEIYNKLLK